MVLRQSAIDPSFYEIIDNGIVVHEIRVEFLIRRAPSFDSIDDAIQWIRDAEWKGAKAAAYRWLAGRSYPKPLLKKKSKLTIVRFQTSR